MLAEHTKLPCCNWSNLGGNQNKGIHGIKKALCGNKSRQCPNCGLERSSRTRESCMDLSVLTARNQATGLGMSFKAGRCEGKI